MSIGPQAATHEISAHPAADYFPLLAGEAFEQLKASIANVGLLMPIVLCEGLILDGRNRYRACMELGIAPRFQNFDGGSPVAGAWALNAERRHLSPSQRAAIAVKMLAPLKAEAKKRQEATGTKSPRDSAGHFRPVAPELVQPEKGRAIEHAARIVGVGKTTVQMAKAVSERDPEIFRQVESGAMSVDKAHKIVTARGAPAISQKTTRKSSTPARDARIGLDDARHFIQKLDSAVDGLFARWQDEKKKMSLLPNTELQSAIKALRERRTQLTTIIKHLETLA